MSMSMADDSSARSHRRSGRSVVAVHLNPAPAGRLILEATMQINRNAPATAAGELRIDADQRTVYAVLSAIEQWPSWNPDVRWVRLQGPVQPGTVFRWKAGLSSLTSTLQVVDPPHELTWTGTTMGIKAVHVFRLQPADGGTLARSEESWEGPLASLLKRSSRKTLDRGIRSVLERLKAEAERRNATP
jgi:hypothetical protein